MRKILAVRVGGRLGQFACRGVGLGLPRTASAPTLSRRATTNFYRRFPGDYLRDTQHLTTLQHGVYALLLDTLYATEKPIASVSDAFQIARCHSQYSKKVALAVIQSMFLVDGTGKIWHKRVDEEIKYAESRRLKASKGASTRWEKNAPSNAPSNQQGMPVLDSRLQTSETTNTKSKALAPTAGASELFGFTIFWDAYPKQVGKVAARRAWLSKVKDDSRYPEIIAGLEMWKQSEQWQEIRFIPEPANWLNEMRWQDRVPENGGSKRERDIEKSIRESIELGRELGLGTNDLEVGHTPRPALQPEGTLLTRRKTNLH